MTDAERQKLCEELKSVGMDEPGGNADICHAAAAEIDRLAFHIKRLKQIIRARDKVRQNDVGVAE